VGREAFREAPVHFAQEGARLLHPAPALEQAAGARRGAQLVGQGALLPGEGKRGREGRRGPGFVRLRQEEQEVAPQALELPVLEPVELAARRLQGFLDHGQSLAHRIDLDQTLDEDGATESLALAVAEREEAGQALADAGEPAVDLPEPHFGPTADAARVVPDVAEAVLARQIETADHKAVGPLGVVELPVEFRDEVVPTVSMYGAVTFSRNATIWSRKATAVSGSPHSQRHQK